MSQNTSSGKTGEAMIASGVAQPQTSSQQQFTPSRMITVPSSVNRLRWPVSGRMGVMLFSSGRHVTRWIGFSARQDQEIGQYFVGGRVPQPRWPMPGQLARKEPSLSF